MADGSIIIDTHIDNAQAQKELASLKKSMAKLSNTLSGKKTEQSAIAREMQQADAAIEGTFQNIKRLEAEMASLEGINLKDNTSGEYFAAQTRIPQIKAELEAQRATLEKQGQAADKVAARYDKISAEVNKISAELEEATAKSGRLAAQITGAGAASAGTAKATRRATSETVKFRKRILELTKSALIFSVLTRALTVMRDWLGRTVAASEEASAAISAFKGSLQGLTAPILNAVIPALIKIVQVITQIISLISRGVAALFGMTNKQALSTAEGLNAEQKALEGVGGAASDAEKQLASFDEINKLTEPSGGGGGGIDSLAPSFEEIELPAWMVSVADKLANAFEKLKEAINNLRQNETFQQIVQFIKDLVEWGATAVVLTVANAIEALALALDLLDKALDGDVIGALESLFNLDWQIIKTILIPFQTLFNLIGGRIESSGLSDAGKALAAIFTGSWIKDLLNLVTGGAFEKILGGLGLFKWLESIDLKKWWTEDIKPWFTKDRWQQLWLDVKQGISNGWNTIVTWWKNSALVIWFNSDVKPWFTRDRWVQLWDNVKQAFTEGWAKIVSWWQGSALVKWWSSDVKPWFTLDRWKQLWFDVKTGFTQGWQDIKTWWNTAISTWWSQNVAVWFTADKWSSIMGGIGSAFSGAFKSAANAAIRIINSMISTINNALKITLPSWDLMDTIGLSAWKGRTLSLGSIPSIPYLAQGAVIPPNQEFMAVLGDQKSGTNIETPLSTMVQAFRQALNEGGRGGQRTIVLEVDKRELGRVTFDLYNAEAQRVGVSLGGA